MQRNTWRDFVYFSNSERKGLVVLIFLTIITVSFNYVVPEYISQKNIKQFEEDNACFLYETRQTTHSYNSKKRNLAEPDIEDKIAKGRESKKHKTNTIAQVEPKQPDVIFINAATAQDFSSLTGIDREVAFRIIKFRNKLGGFHSSDQLKQVFGLTDDMFLEIKTKIKVQPESISRININVADFDQLDAHPYISDRLASQIINYRTKVKRFETGNDVKKLYLVDDQLYGKLVPYFTY